MIPDFIINGQGHGHVGQRLAAVGGDTGILRPYFSDDPRDPRTYMTVNQGGEDRQIVTNAPATLRIREWIFLEEAVQKVARKRLAAFNKLRANASYSLPGGLRHTVLQSQNVSDISPATVSMNGIRKSERDRVVYDSVQLPIPIIHKDFSFTWRDLDQSRNGGPGLDTTELTMATTRVMEEVEKMVLGLRTFAYSGASIWGYGNFPQRVAYSITDPTVGGWTPNQLILDVLGMKQAAKVALHYGPFDLYMGTEWDQYLGEDYSAAKGDRLLMERLAAIPGIASVNTFDFLDGFDMFLVPQDETVARAVIAQDLTIVQWQEEGGMEYFFKVLCSLLPQLRADQNDNCGIVHGS